MAFSSFSTLRMFSIFVEYVYLSCSFFQRFSAELDVTNVATSDRYSVREDSADDSVTLVLNATQGNNVCAYSRVTGFGHRIIG